MLAEIEAATLNDYGNLGVFKYIFPVAYLLNVPLSPFSTPESHYLDISFCNVIDVA